MFSPAMRRGLTCGRVQEECESRDDAGDDEDWYAQPFAPSTKEGVDEPC